MKPTNTISLQYAMIADELGSIKFRQKRASILGERLLADDEYEAVVEHLQTEIQRLRALGNGRPWPQQMSLFLGA
jgi:hypothetical protein